MTDPLVWYAAYGSNLAAARFRCYVVGGRPAGAARAYPGCRDPRLPRDDRPVVSDGVVHFAGASSVWGGGMAFYDPERRGRALLRAWLVTREQLLDVLTQEMRGDPTVSGSLRLPHGIEDEPVVRLGPGRYETLHRVATLDGRPVLTLSHGVAEAPQANPPSATYLRWVVTGLHESHGMPPHQVAVYLAECPGIGWDTGQLEALAAAVLAGG